MRRATLAVNGVPVGWPVACCDSFWWRLRGQLAARRRHGLIWMLSPCSAVHSFFLAQPIDVAFCDTDGLIVRVFVPMQAWRLAAARGAASAWEFPAGSLDRLALGRGDRLSLCA